MMVDFQKHICESTGLMFEFYAKVNVNPAQTKVTKDMEIWIYGNDRDQMTPHCHIFNSDIEIEVSLLDWSIVNVKRPRHLSTEWANFATFRERLQKWLKLPNNDGNPNYFSILALWNHANPENTLNEFVKNHQDIKFSDELNNFLQSRTRYLQNIYKQVTNALFAEYYTHDKKFSFHKYNPIELLRVLDLDIAIDEEDSDAMQAVINAENFVQKTIK